MLKLQLIIRPGGERSEHSLAEGLWTAGGGDDDAVLLPALPPGALRIETNPFGAIVTPHRVEARIGLLAFRQGERRLVRPGERVSVGDYDLHVQALEGGPCQDGERCAEAGRPARGPAVLWLNGRDCARRVSLKSGVTLVGRGENCALRVRDARASRAHARIVLAGGEVFLVDSGSRNGLKLNGVTVEGEQRLSGGEVITLGATDLAFEAALEPALRAPIAPGRRLSPSEYPTTPEVVPSHRFWKAWHLALACSAALAAAIVAHWFFGS